MSCRAKYVLVIVKHFSKWIEFVALLQNSLELVAMVFLDQVLTHFRAFVDVLMDQGLKFLRNFEALYIKALIDYCTMSRNHPKVNSLADPYQLLYGWESILLSLIFEKLASILELDEPDVWAQCLYDWTKFFKQTMSMAMKNLSIAQYCNTLQYAHIHSRA
uniref:Uncharacterized protein n=2 Tax=Physcomitrium patens TaxID=3218 RepID=A0A7I4EYT7_PHYPA